MKQYTVTGMSCAACSARVEKAVGKVKGVKSVNVILTFDPVWDKSMMSEEALLELGML